MTLVAITLFPVLTAPGANIAWVSLHPADETPSSGAAGAGFTNAPDIGYTRLLRTHGHTVTRCVAVNNLDQNPDLLAGLSTNDLIILSRSVDNGTLQQSSTITGEWTDVPGNPTSPYLVTPSNGATFYRARP